MGQRTRNRIKEHTQPGHDLVQSNTNAKGIEVVKTSEHDGKLFWICKCGWEGWLTIDLNRKE